MMPLLPVLLLVTLSPGAPSAENQNPVEEARHFVPPNAQLAQLYEFDYRTGRVSSEFPAVLTGHIMSPESNDIILAYYSPRVDTLPKTLFVTLLHPTSTGYEKEYELAYRSQVLLAPSALQILRLREQARDAVAVIHGTGAALGGQIEVFRWEEPWGWRNIFPANSSAHYFTILPDHGRVKVRLGYGNKPDATTPRPEEFTWNGEEFVKGK